MFMQDFARLSPAQITVAGLPLSSGLHAATLVETRAGWQAAGSLRPGDAVHTLDGGLRRIVAMDRAWIMPALGHDIMQVPGGAFGNDDAITLLPGQHLLTDLTLTDADVGDLPDAMAVLVPAVALDGFRGAHRRRISRVMEVVAPLFEEEEYVWAASGLLLHCPAADSGRGALPSSGGTFPRLSEAAARRLLAARMTMDSALPGWAM